MVYFLLMYLDAISSEKGSDIQDISTSSGEDEQSNISSGRDKQVNDSQKFGEAFISSGRDEKSNDISELEEMKMLGKDIENMKEKLKVISNDFEKFRQNVKKLESLNRKHNISKKKGNGTC